MNESIECIILGMLYPNFSFEKKVWQEGFKCIAGCDEVGRGCFAGPVVAGVVVFSDKTVVEEGIVINDSKQIRSKTREKATVWIKKNSLAWGIGVVSVTKINKIGIGGATQMAMRKAIKEANNRLNSSKIDFILIDAFYIPHTKGLKRKNQKPIIKGDGKSISIAASSIIAKVERDKIMLSLSKNPKYKKYGWGRNKGYGTKEHQEALKLHGITRHHRKQFVATFFSR